MNNLKAGDLRHRLTIQKRKTSVGTRGQDVESWETVGKAWGKIEPIWGMELEVARRRQSDVTTRIITRYMRIRDLGADHRICHKGSVYQIGFIQERDDDLRTLSIICTRSSEDE